MVERGSMSDGLVLRVQAAENCDSQNGRSPEIRALSKGLAVLKLFRRDRPYLTLADVVRDGGLPRATAYRVLRTMELSGFLRFDEAAKSYLLGPALSPLGYVVRTQVHVTNLLRPDLQELFDQVGETTILVMSVGTYHGVTVDRVEPRIPFKFDLGREIIGDNLACAPCKIFAAELSDAEIRAIVAHNPPLTRYSITDPEEMLRTLDAVRRDGVSFDLREASANMCAVCAPVRDQVGSIAAVVGILSIPEHFSEAAKRTFAEQVKGTAQRMSERLKEL